MVLESVYGSFGKWSCASYRIDAATVLLYNGKGNKTDCRNYRISLFIIDDKIYTTVINHIKRMMEPLAHNGQGRFREVKRMCRPYFLHLGK